MSSQPKKGNSGPKTSLQLKNIEESISFTQSSNQSKTQSDIHSDPSEATKKFHLSNSENTHFNEIISSSSQFSNYESAGFWTRAGALIFDLILFFIVQCFLSYILLKIFKLNFEGINSNALAANTNQPPPTTLLEVMKLINLKGFIKPILIPFLVLQTFFFLYFIFSIKYFSGTLGKKLVGIIVVSEQDELQWHQILRRETFGKSISFFPFGLGFFISLFSKNKKCLHDHLAKTRVVYTEKMLIASTGKRFFRASLSYLVAGGKWAFLKKEEFFHFFMSYPHSFCNFPAIS